MAIADDFHAALLASYQRAIDETGYRASRFKQALDRRGGVATAKRMLSPRTKNQRAGLDRLLEAGKPELTLEYIALQPQFAELFSTEELEAARQRLAGFLAESAAVRSAREQLYPDELEPGQQYNEGAKKQVRVNRYERDPRARKACLAHHGTACAVCNLDFERRYGAHGRGFIHVHHLRPLSDPGAPDSVDPRADMVPVCPNCHAMLHYGKRLLSIVELQGLLLDVAA